MAYTHQTSKTKYTTSCAATLYALCYFVGPIIFNRDTHCYCLIWFQLYWLTIHEWTWYVAKKPKSQSRVVESLSSEQPAASVRDAARLGRFFNYRNRISRMQTPSILYARNGIERNNVHRIWNTAEITASPNKFAGFWSLCCRDSIISHSTATRGQALGSCWVYCWVGLV